MTQIFVVFIEEEPTKLQAFTNLEAAKAHAQTLYDEGTEPEDRLDNQLEWTIEDNVHYGQLPYDNMPTIIVPVELQ